MHSPELKEKAEKWLKKPITQRKPKSKSAFCRSIGISIPTLDKWEVELRGGRIISPSVNIDDLPIEEKIKIFDQLLFELIQDPKTPSKDRELFAKRYGLLIDKSETTHKFEISADELTREFIRARRELEGQGDSQVLTRPAVFSKPVLLDTGQGEDADGEVGGLAVSS